MQWTRSAEREFKASHLRFEKKKRRHVNRALNRQESPESARAAALVEHSRKVHQLVQEIRAVVLLTSTER